MDYGPDDLVERDAPEPPFQQLAGILRARLARGDWKPRRPIPSESRLCDEYGLSRPTVRRAVAELVAAELVFTVPQRGTYVAEPTRGDDRQDDAPDA
ncbi:winged helix-turn-helix domain-containing protein [Streptomyces sp. SID11385]|uniref:GntR family transcriptional regulator n=1 Tax=Streptomyces sp. SID11385 TaxID=2706031 RepID=UPI0013C803E9|nr:winged helix-turn-helix domain-containing protein [Streptomyces sp. SID11385]NEA44531.1 winged helix-turn-helix transcriptional regulator [Streptomyces sp. SID11385]